MIPLFIFMSGKDSTIRLIFSDIKVSAPKRVSCIEIWSITDYRRIKSQILEHIGTIEHKPPAEDEIGRTRHDARKTLSSLMAMVNALAPENAGRIIEDINRETTTLMSMLNSYRDSMAMAHEVNLKDLIRDRLIPYVEAAPGNIELTIVFSAATPTVLGHWLNISRALVNLTSNAIDAMSETDRDPRLYIALEDEERTHVVLRIADNGTGIPPELLELDSEGKPAFIGKSTKADGKGEGFGTMQVWTVFGSEMLSIKSTVGVGTEWSIRFERSASGLTKSFSALQRQFHVLQGLQEELEISESSSRTDVIAEIWRLRQKEIFLFELLERFSRHYNIRDLYREILAYFQGNISEEEFERRVSEWKGEHRALNSWLSTIARRICIRYNELSSCIDLDEYSGALFKSYGQAVDNVIIFTLNPADGRFLATDRKLAEHLDFVPYLGGVRSKMLRGEFVGDVNNDDNPIYLGVWSVESEEDLREKMCLLREGAGTILSFGIHPEKRLAFYQTTYVRYEKDVDSDASSTIGEFSALSDEDLMKYVRDAENEAMGYLSALD